MTRGISRLAWSLRTATMQPGNSGGALVDERGNVVGLVSAKVLADCHQAHGRRWRRAGRCRRM